MEVSTKTEQDVTVITIDGELDGKTSPVAQENILPACTSECTIALDMSGVTFMSSAGLRLMLSIYRKVTAVNGKLVLVGLSEELADTMSATGFLEYFTTATTQDEGIAALKG